MLVTKDWSGKFQVMPSVVNIKLSKSRDSASTRVLPGQKLTADKMWAESTASATHHMAQSPVRQKSPKHSSLAGYSLQPWLPECGGQRGSAYFPKSQPLPQFRKSLLLS